MRVSFKPSISTLSLLHDAAMAAASFALALYLRLGDRMETHAASYLVPGMAAFAVLLVAVLLRFRTQRRMWRYTSLNDLLVLARAGTIALVVFYLGMFMLTRLESLPRSVPVIHWMCLMLCLTGPRVLARVLNDRTLVDRMLGRGGTTRVPVLLIGANSAAEMFIRESERDGEFPYRVVGLIDDDPRQHGREIHHVRIYGGTHEVGYIIGKLVRKGRAPQRLLLTEGRSLPRATYDALLAQAAAHNLTLARLPSLSELQSGERMRDVHPVAVEDILGRPQAVLDRAAMRAFVQGKRVLVTGAGGSIGSELVRQIAEDGPAQLLLYELSEFALYGIEREVVAHWPELPHRAVLGDVRDADQLARIFAEFQPEIVFHAAAIKHVPLAESNPDQAVLTNVLGSKRVVDACLAHGVATMVQISTDKAVNPSSVMGASKRAAEIYAAAQAQEGATRFVTVRFGNVLNSAGSVVPLFQKQLAAGGPLTVTHREMVRYFMTIREAVQLVLQAAVLGAVSGEEGAKIYVLDMGEPIRIEELACQMIRLAGFKPYEEIDIVFTGLRPGEKLFEELFHDDENLMETSHRAIRLARARPIEKEPVLAAIDMVVAAAARGEAAAIPGLLQQVVAEYQASNVIRFGKTHAS